jgi:ParB/RepB/Spo0J family partition protein
MTATTVGYHQEFPLAQLHESPLNPRRTYDPAKLAELAASIKAQGIITPLLARPNAKGAEIAAGHRRLRAAKMAEVTTGPVIIREMTDAEFVEVLNIENLQREDLTPLEEAEGYKLLMTKAGYDAKRIAERVGKSEKYVYDRVKLLQLIEPARRLLRDGGITAGHAILLARLTPEDQRRIVTPDKNAPDGESVLMKSDAMLLTPEEEDKRSEKAAWPLKSISVRELETWIAERVRFKAILADPILFPETTTAVQTATAQKEKVVEITHESFVQEEARAGRTIRAGYWQRADGKQGSKTCDRAVTGVIVVGPGQGDAFRVCVDRERCQVHWAKEIKAKAARAKQPARATPTARPAVNSWEQEQAKRKAAEARSDAALPAIFTALAEKVKKAPAGAKGPLGKILLDESRGEADEYMPLGTTADDLVRFLAFDVLTEHPDRWHGLKEFAADLKPFGVDVKKHLADVDKAAAAKKDAPAAASGRAAKKAPTKKAKK